MNGLGCTPACKSKQALLPLHARVYYMQDDDDDDGSSDLDESDSDSDEE